MRTLLIALALGMVAGSAAGRGLRQDVPAAAAADGLPPLLPPLPNPGAASVPNLLGQPMRGAIRIVADMDSAIDDFAALAAVQAASRMPGSPYKLVGVSTSDGLVGVEDGAVFAKRFMKAVGNDVPINKGKATPTVGTRKFPTNWATRNVGALERVIPSLSNPADFYTPFIEDGLDRLLEQAGCSSLAPCFVLATGPFTNIGRALQSWLWVRQRVAGVIYPAMNNGTYTEEQKLRGVAKKVGVSGNCAWTIGLNTALHPSPLGLPPTTVITEGAFTALPDSGSQANTWIKSTNDDIGNALMLGTWNGLVNDCLTKGLASPSTRPSGGPANIAELNTYIDPVAADQMLRSSTPLAMFGQEVTKSDGTSLNEYSAGGNVVRPAVFGPGDGALVAATCPNGAPLPIAGRLLRDALRSQPESGGGGTVYDMVAAIGMLKPDLFAYDCVRVAVSTNFGQPMWPAPANHPNPDTAGSVTQYDVKLTGEQVTPTSACPRGTVKSARALVDASGAAYWAFVASLVYGGC